MICVSENTLRRICGCFGRFFSWYERLPAFLRAHKCLPRHLLWRRLWAVCGSSRLKVICRTAYGFKMLVELGQFAEVTAAIGRNSEEVVVHAFSRLKTGDVVVDAGANVGRYTLLAAATIGERGRVLAFEPNAEIAAKLLGNVELNGFRNVDIHQFALGAASGETLLFTGSDHGWSSTSAAWIQVRGNERPASQKKAALRTLDSVLEDAGITCVKLCKIDVEGAELEVLRGARNSLARQTIRLIVCEVHEPLISQASVASCLEQNHYQVDFKNEFAFAEPVTTAEAHEGFARKA